MGKLLHKFTQVVIRVLFIALAVPLVLICRTIKPFIRVRFGYFVADRIGPFSFDVGYYLCEDEVNQNKRRYLDFFYLRGVPANKALVRISKRAIKISPIVRYFFEANRYLPFNKGYTILPANHRNGSRDREGLLRRTKSQLCFTPDEIRIGTQYLGNVGCDSIERIICLLPRDGSYMKQYHSYRDWSYHDFRNTDVDDYLLAATTLADRGYWVFRMGKSVEKTMSTNHPQVIDYASSPDRSDILDIWLMANCRFVITTGTGLDCVADIFRRPMVYVNYMPLVDMISWAVNITVPKLLMWKENGKLLTLNEYLDHDFMKGFEYEDVGIMVNDLSPVDILNAVLEMDNYLDGKSEASADDIRLQLRFRNIIKNHHKYSKYHGEFCLDARIGTDFLKRLELN